jgi:hypothetical protein
MMTTKLCAALAAVLAISASGAAMAQSYYPDQAADPSGYGPPPPPPGDNERYGDQQGYGPPPDTRSGQDQSAPGSYPDQNRPYGDQRAPDTDPRDDYGARMAHYRSQQALYQHQLRVYERARRDYDMQFGPGAYERYYAPPPPGQ